MTSSVTITALTLSSLADVHNNYCCITKAMPIHFIDDKCYIKKLKSCRYGLTSYYRCILHVLLIPSVYTHLYTHTYTHAHTCTHTRTHTRTHAHTPVSWTKAFFLETRHIELMQGHFIIFILNIDYS